MFTLSLCFDENQHASFLSTNENILSSDPYYIRQLGGEELIIDLQCLPNQTAVSKVRSKFGSSSQTIEATQLSPTQIVFYTPPLFYLGPTTVHLSIDSGESFPYKGEVFVEDLDILLPFITVEDELSFVIDFTADKIETLTWNKELIHDKYLTLSLLIVLDPISKSSYEWDSTIVLLEDVENSGTLSFNLSSLTINGLLYSFPLTVGSYILFGRNPNFYFTGPALMIQFTALPVSVCYQFDDILQQTPQGLLPCPCISTQADSDSGYTLEEDYPLRDFFHPGVERCYRSVSSESGSSEQCCYNPDKSVNLGTFGSGTADTYSPQYCPIMHIIYDILPWFVCCVLRRDHCDYYSKYRPTNDCSGYASTVQE